MKPPMNLGSLEFKLYFWIGLPGITHVQIYSPKAHTRA